MIIMKIGRASVNIPSATIVANEFIDEYMPHANGEYVKIFLYILRHGEEQVSEEMIADALELTAADVTRALSYWKRCGLLDINEDEQAAPAEIPEPEAPAGKPEAAERPAADVLRLQDDEEFAELLYCIQKYMSKIFSRNDMEIVAYMYDELKMPRELIEYLVEICVKRGKTSLRYMETIARSWHSQGINTVEQARQESSVYSSEVWGVMKAFGISDRNPGEAEQEYIDRWFRQWGFSQEMVSEACARTLTAIGKPGFKYADSILERWHKAGAAELKDVERLDREHSDRSRAAGNARAASGKAVGGSFGSFAQRDDDIDKAALDRLKDKLKDY